MMTLTPTEPDFEDFGLFSDLVEQIEAASDFVPPMPDDLKAFDRGFTGKEIAVAARTVFLHWLTVELGGRNLVIPADESLPCNDAEIADQFFPEWPAEEDYPNATTGELNRLHAMADIDAAFAKRACGPCPMRTLCLARSMNADAVYEQYEPVVFEGIAGGMGPGARKSVFRAFTVLRRRYRNGVNDREQGKMPNPVTSMTADEIGELANETQAA